MVDGNTVPESIERVCRLQSHGLLSSVCSKYVFLPVAPKKWHRCLYKFHTEDHVGIPLLKVLYFHYCDCSYEFFSFPEQTQKIWKSNY